MRKYDNPNKGILQAPGGIGFFGEAMDMEERFMNCGRLCRRWTLDGVAVEVETREDVTRCYGRDWPTRITVWKGTHMLDDGRTARKVTRSETWDSGPRVGLSLVSVIEPDGDGAERREALKAAVEDLFPGRTLSDRGA